MRTSYFIIFSVLLFSCGRNTFSDKKPNSDQTAQTKISEKSNLAVKKKPVRFYKDRCEFKAYNDNFDYWFIEVLSNNQLIGYVNDSDTRNLLRGDQIELTWKYDTIYIAGDGERPEVVKWMVSIKKIVDGNVSMFRKTAKKLEYHPSPEEDYSDSYLNDLYLLAEYYIANSKNASIKNAINEKQQIEYSLEDRKKNERDYTVIGIGTTIENRLSVMQWIYIDQENQSIYEYDLAKDKLVKFD